MPLDRQPNLICLITDRHRAYPGGDTERALDAVLTLVAAAAQAGVDLIQIRERDLDARRLGDLVARCVAATTGSGSRIVVNDRIDVALAAGAHGVHLRHDSLPAVRVRDMVTEHFIVGRSVHGADEALSAAGGGGLDYLMMGTLFETPSKGPLRTLTPASALQRATALTPVPILAVGGITIERAEEVTRMGASGVASIGLFLPPSGVELRTHLRACVTGLREAFDACDASKP